MSNVEVGPKGITFPTWIVGAIVTIFLAWAGWTSSRIEAANAKAGDMMQQLVELRAQVRSSAVPEGTEKALNELRSRMNAELAGTNALAKLATENAKDIQYNTREIQALKDQVKALQERKP